MSGIEDKESAMLKLAQFKLFNDNEDFANKNAKLILERLDLNAKIPETNYLKENDNLGIGDSLLHLAYKENNINMYKSLVGKGADFTTKDSNGSTVIHAVFRSFCVDYHLISNWSCQKAKTAAEYISTTLSAHVEQKNASNPSDSNGLNHFHIACATNNTQAAEFFLNNGVSVNQAVICVSSNKYFEGYTALHMAVKFGYVQVVAILLKHGADINLEDDNGKTPLHVALEKNIELMDSAHRVYLPETVELNERIINLLLNHSICAKMPHFFVASAMSSFPVKKFLIQEINVNQSVSMDSKIWPGYTALHFAASVNVNTVKFLMRHRANILAKEANGVTPFDMCMDRYKLADIIDIINLVPMWKDIVLSDGETKLVDLLLVFKTMTDLKSFLLISRGHVKLFVPLDSPLWPGFTVLHLAILFSERKKCRTDYKHQEDKAGAFDPNLDIITECLKQDADVTVTDKRNWTAVHFAFRLDKRNTLILLLKYHHRITNCMDENHLSHLHIACHIGNDDLVKKLVWNDADVNVVYKGDTALLNVHQEWTPLHVALYAENCEIVKLLLQFGADIYATDMYGFTPIHYLIHCSKNPQDLSDIAFDVQNLRDFIVKDIGLNYLHIACKTTNYATAKRLLDIGSDINKVVTCTPSDVRKNWQSIFNYEDYDGNTPLLFLLEDNDSESSELFELLLKRGANILAKNSNDMSPLIKVLRSGNSEYMNIIINFLKGNVDLQNRVQVETGITLLHVACRKVDVDLIEELLNNKANINAQIHEDSTLWPKFTCLHVLLAGEDEFNEYDEDAEEAINLLLNHNADVTLTNKDEDTPVHVAYRNLCIDPDDLVSQNILISLLKAHNNFEINPSSIEGLSHFHMACQMLEVDVVENFLKHDVDVNAQIDMFCDSKIAAATPLHLAINSMRDLRQTDDTNPFPKLLAQLKIVDSLIKHGADVNVKDVHENTPAHYIGSLNSSKENLLQRLASCRANLNAINVRGETPLEILLRKNTISLQEVRHFIAFGCRFNAFNVMTEKGYIALADASLTGQDMHLLLFGAFVNSPELVKVDDMIRNAIHNVVSINNSASTSVKYSDVFDVLTTLGCDIDGQDYLGRTPLHYASLFRNQSAVAGLLLAGADINVCDRTGKTPFAYAFEACTSRCPKSNVKGHDQYQHAELFTTFFSQIKKMELCDIYVNQSNGLLCDKAADRVESYDIINDVNVTLPEITRGTGMKIKPYSLSAADFVTPGLAVIDYPTMSLAKRRSVDEFFRANRKPFQTQFKQTAGIFQLQYRQAVLRRKIMNTAIEALRALAKCRLPDICSHIILRSLKNYELQNLIASIAKRYNLPIR